MALDKYSLFRYLDPLGIAESASSGSASGAALIQDSYTKACTLNLHPANLKQVFLCSEPP